ncbi:MAG TPA: 2-hydroxychromene-2-carboxylate isomerase [Roseiarcus sp.]|nr:2-hydroxychromene-2-carboxylate isomerase [Roseiarcus sp.]
MHDPKPALDFWYEFASTYSYPAAMRIEALAAARGVAVRWRPFLLGPLFAEQGWRDSPFNIYPVKGRYMWRDLARVCESLGLPLIRPEPFPQNTLLAARVALALPEAERAAFSRAVYAAEFGQGRAVSEPAVVAELIGAGAEATLARAQSPDNKAALKAAGEQAKALGLPGAPCCVTASGEIFWGNDRLEQAVEWALRG